MSRIILFENLFENITLLNLVMDIEFIFFDFSR
jgi:hypothetical protein